MTLGDCQRLFFEVFIMWASWALAQGYRFTFGEAMRSDEQAEINALGAQGREHVAQLLDRRFVLLAAKIRNNGNNNGIRRTAHSLQLALDLNAFKEGRYLTKTDDWRELGEYWESLHPLCRWGGRFDDGNHLSFEYDGVK